LYFVKTGRLATGNLLFLCKNLILPFIFLDNFSNILNRGYYCYGLPEKEVSLIRRLGFL